MQPRNRLTRVVYRDDVGIIAPDNVGRIHRLDDDLRLVASSPVISPAYPIYAVALADDVVVTKDKYGTLAKWSLETLDPIDVIDAWTLRDERDLLEGEEPSPTVHRGLGIWNGRVFTNNGYLQFTVLDLRTFAVEQILPALSEAHLEWFCTDRPGLHAVSDKIGRLYLGDLDAFEFPVRVKLDDGANLHRVAYDPVHDRFWVTQDSGEGELEDIANGVVTVLPDGTVEQSLEFAQDDVECLGFSPDYSEVYIGGFDGMVHVFDNTSRQLRITRSIGPFTHQVTDLAVGSDGHLFVLGQDGVLVKVDPHGRKATRNGFHPQCAWDLQPDPTDARRIYAATDDGVAVLRAADRAPHHNLAVTVEAHHRHGMGFSRRVVALPDGYAAITRARYVYRAGRDGEVRWRRRVDGLTQTASLSPDGQRLLVATSKGGLELRLDDGGVVAELQIDGLPIWASAYLPDGARVLASRNGSVVAFEDDGSVRWRLDMGQYPKRMWVDRGWLYVSGEGGVKQVAPAGSGVERAWYELLDNTCENGLVVGDTVYAVTYGSQLGVYWYDSCELRGVVEPMPDLTKAIAAVHTDDDQAFLLVGGRGGFVGVYWLDDGEPRRVRDVYLTPADPATLSPDEPGVVPARELTGAGTVG